MSVTNLLLVFTNRNAFADCMQYLIGSQCCQYVHCYMFVKKEVISKLPYTNPIRVKPLYRELDYTTITINMTFESVKYSN